MTDAFSEASRQAEPYIDRDAREREMGNSIKELNLRADDPVLIQWKKGGVQQTDRTRAIFVSLNKKGASHRKSGRVVSVSLRFEDSSVEEIKPRHIGSITRRA